MRVIAVGDGATFDSKQLAFAPPGKAPVYLWLSVLTQRLPRLSCTREDGMKSTTQKLSEIEQLADVFGLVTARFLRDSQNKAELARAAGDHQELIKEQIKIEVLRQTRNIFEHNYKRITGREPWSNQDDESKRRGATRN